MDQTYRPPRQGLRLPKVLERTGISRSHLYRLIARGDFPPFHKASDRVSIWDSEAIDRWLADRLDGGTK